MEFTPIGTEIVDTHLHLWRLEAGQEYFSSPETKMLCREFGLSDMEEASAPVRVKAFVFIHAGEKREDNDYMERMAASSDLICGIVPYADLENPAIDRELDRWQTNPKFRGVRVAIEIYPDPDYMVRPAVLDGLGELAARGLSFDFLVHTHHLKHVLTVYERHPTLMGIIDHIAKPDMATGKNAPEWREWMRRLAEIPNLCCKISGLLTEAGADWTVERVEPYVQFAIEQFGFDRVMWGSDWPVATLRADYETTFKAVRKAAGEISPAEEAKLYRDNAVRFYRLEGV